MHTFSLVNIQADEKQGSLSHSSQAPIITYEEQTWTPSKHTRAMKGEQRHQRNIKVTLDDRRMWDRPPALTQSHTEGSALFPPILL